MNSRIAAVVMALAAAAAAPAAAVELVVDAHDADGRALSQVVVTVDALPRVGPPPVADTATVDQVNRTFDPHVSVIPQGTAVLFPNRDDIRHHLYSFSEAKTFELPLYKGTPAEPIVFDKAGIVTLACNIHDWMLAFVYVTDARWATVTGTDGRAEFTLPEHDRYRVTVWHPSLGPDTPGIVRELERGDGALEWVVELEPSAQRGSRRLRRGAGRYR